MKRLEKTQRQKWWLSLTPEQRMEKIKKWAKDKKPAQEKPPQKYNPEYPWMTEGVNSKNRAQWFKMIHRKNPWLKVA